MEGHTLRRSIRVVVLLLPVALLGCSLLAPSDEELMGGLSKASEAGTDSGEGGSDAAERDGSCGAANATCSTGGDCCSGRCRGNGMCL